MWTEITGRLGPVYEAYLWVKSALVQEYEETLERVEDGKQVLKHNGGAIDGQ